MPKATDTCIVCDAGKYLSIQKNLDIETQDGTHVVVPHVPVLRCDACGDEIVPPSSHSFVDRYVKDATEQLTKTDVQRLFTGLDRTQAAVTEDLGLGPKTLTRWISGSQHPNRAMGFYLRVMAEFPQVYTWVKNRTWKTQDAELAANRGSGINQQIYRYLDLEAVSAPLPLTPGANHAVAFRNSHRSVSAAA